MSTDTDGPGRVAWIRGVLCASSLLILSACGSEPDTPAKRLDETVMKAVTRHGGAARASVAVLRALDASYSISQVAAALRSGSLTDAGEIPGQSPDRRSGGTEPVRPVGKATIEAVSRQLFAHVPQEQHDSWARWILTGAAMGHDAPNLVAGIRWALEQGRAEPELQDEGRLAVVRNASGAQATAKYAYAPSLVAGPVTSVRIGFREGNRPRPRRAPERLSPGTIPVSLTISERDKPYWAIVSSSASLVVGSKGGTDTISGKFSVRLLDRRSRRTERVESIIGTFLKREHKLIYPVRVRLHAKYTRTVFSEGKRVGSQNTTSHNAFGGMITSTWARGTFSPPICTLDWQIEGLTHSDVEQPSGAIYLDPQAATRFREESEALAKQAGSPGAVAYTGVGSFKLSVVNVNEITADASIHVYLRPDGTVSGKITYESVDLFTGKKVGPSKTMLITGTHTANEHGRGTLRATLRAPRKEFPNALRGIFDEKTMRISARLQETQPMIANTTIRAEHLQRK